MNILYLKHTSYRSSNVHVKFTCCSQVWQNFGGDKYLYKLGKKYLNSSICKSVIYLLHHSETFDVSRVFLPLIIAKLSTFKQVRFFWPTLYKPSGRWVNFTDRDVDRGASIGQPVTTSHHIRGTGQLPSVCVTRLQIQPPCTQSV